MFKVHAASVEEYFRFDPAGGRVARTRPVLGIALQKNYLSFYSNAYGYGAPFTGAYAGKLGRARVSAKGVVTLTDIGDISLEALAGMVTAIAAGLESGELVAR